MGGALVSSVQILAVPTLSPTVSLFGSYPSLQAANSQIILGAASVRTA